MSSGLTIDEELLKEIIGSQNADLKDLELFDICETLDNFTGELKGAKFSATTNGNKQDYDIVVKIARKMVSEGLDMGSMLYSKEIYFYRKFIPIVENWQERKFGGVQYEIKVPKSLFGCPERKILVLENLKKYGFRNAVKMYGLNFERCAFTLKAVAAFHALGVAFVQDYGEKKFISDFDFLHDSFSAVFENEEMVKAVQAMDKNTLESIDSLLTAAYPDEIPAIKDMIEFGKKFDITRKIKKYSTPNDKFNVIGHGDLWTNNILYKFDEDENPRDIRFIDFQLMRYSTPASDLIYFIWMSGDKNVLVNKQDELLKIYYECLKQELQKLNIELTYTFDELVEDYYHFIDFGVMQCVKTSLFFDAKKGDDFQVDGIDNMISDELMTKLSNKLDEISHQASTTLKEKLINVVHYGKRLNLF